jgi:cell division protein FtsL
MADKDRTISEAHSRIDDLLLEVRQHVVSCSVQTRQQNSRLRRLEAILITTAGATILMLISIIIQ